MYMSKLNRTAYIRLTHIPEKENILFSEIFVKGSASVRRTPSWDGHLGFNRIYCSSKACSESFYHQLARRSNSQCMVFYPQGLTGVPMSRYFCIRYVTSSFLFLWRISCHGWNYSQTFLTMKNWGQNHGCEYRLTNFYWKRTFLRVVSAMTGNSPSEIANNLTAASSQKDCSLFEFCKFLSGSDQRCTSSLVLITTDDMPRLCYT